MASSEKLAVRKGSAPSAKAVARAAHTRKSASTPVLSTLLESEHYASLTKELSCQGCSKYMRPPIHLCVDGHSICSACFKVTYQCPKCKKELSQVRSLVLEALAQKVLFPCDHAAAGCPKHATLAHLEKHHPVCQYRTIDCFMARVYGECKWSGCAGEWMEHCLEVHGKQVTELPFITARDKWEPRSGEPVKNYFLMRCFDRVFNVYQIYDRKGGRMMWTVLVNDEQAERYYFEVDIFIPDDHVKRIMYRRPCKCEKDADFLEHTQNVYVPVENIFSMLDKDEYTNYTVRIGEVENLPKLDRKAESENLFLLGEEESQETSKAENE